jgi:AraC family transcriptional regulator
MHFVLDGIYQEQTYRGAENHPARTLLYKPAGEPHWNDFDAGGSRTLRIEFLPAPDIAAPSCGPGHTADPRLCDLAHRLHDELRRPDRFTALAAEGLCLELLAGLGRRQRARRDRRGDVAVRCAGLLEERFREPVSFTELAVELRVSRSHLARVFRAHHRCTMGEYVRQLRVDRVRAALHHSDLSLATIAVSLGFADQSHCARVFRRTLGMTPAEYRRTVR